MKTLPATLQALSNGPPMYSGQLRGTEELQLVMLSNSDADPRQFYCVSQPQAPEIGAFLPFELHTFKKDSNLPRVRPLRESEYGRPPYT